MAEKSRGGSSRQTKRKSDKSIREFHPTINNRRQHLEGNPSLPSQVRIRPPEKRLDLYKLNTQMMPSSSILVYPSEVALAAQLVRWS